jgi:site-specific DNA-methyltransferase (adenine-specific)
MEFVDQIICADCLETMRQIPDNTVHLAVTSPPYNLGINYDIHNDSLAYQEYLDWMKKVWLETKRVLVHGGRFALNIAPTSIKNFRPIHHDFSNQLREIGMIMRTEIIWYKQTMGRRTAWGSWKSPANPHIVPSWEYVLVFSKDSWTLASGTKDTDITADEFMRFSDGFWYIPPESQRRGHPTPFPEELIYRLIRFYTYKDNIVLDMFGGTGTVAVVALKTERHFIYIDISPKYCKIAEERLEAARLLKELPLSLGKPGRKIRISRYSASETVKPPLQRKEKQLAQSRLLESRGPYKPKRAKRKTKHA